MNAIQRLAGQFIYWRQTSIMHTAFEVVDAEHLQALGTLKWLSAMHNRAVTTVDGHTYYLDRKGVLHVQVEMRLGDSAEDAVFGTFKLRWDASGDLTTADGRTYLWRSANFFGSEWKWATPDDGEIMRFSTDFKVRRLLRMDGKIALSGAASDFPDAAPLVALGLYLMILMQIDSAA